MSKSAFSWRRTGAIAGASILAIAVTTGMALGLRDGVAGGLFVWAAVVVSWVLGASLRHDDFPIDRWLGLHFVVLGIAVLIAATIDPIHGGFLQDVFPYAAAITPLLVLRSSSSFGSTSPTERTNGLWPSV